MARISCVLALRQRASPPGSASGPYALGSSSGFTFALPRLPLHPSASAKFIARAEFQHGTYDPCARPAATFQYAQRREVASSVGLFQTVPDLCLPGLAQGAEGGRSSAGVGIGFGNSTSAALNLMRGRFGATWPAEWKPDAEAPGSGPWPRCHPDLHALPQLFGVVVPADLQFAQTAFAAFGGSRHEQSQPAG